MNEAEIAETPEMVARVARALEQYQAAADSAGGCGDGGCVVKRPVGMHTNGGCRCSMDKYKAQRMMRAGQMLFMAVATLTQPTE